MIPTISNIESLRGQIRQWRQQGLTVGFVPTMGNLHQGHMTLIAKARQHADRVVASIFVNPLQFDRADDLANYPRTLERDQIALTDASADLLFTPTPELMYPQGLEAETKVTVPGIGDMLEGAQRPGHFQGVATVVTKLFNLVAPDIACFGEKDFQQLALIRKMTADLMLPIEIIGVPIVRYDDGLAMSSRNSLLNEAQRAIAPRLAQTMQELGEQLKQGHDVKTLVTKASQSLNDAGFQTDTIDVVDAQNLMPLQKNSQQAVILMAAFLGKTRLIDNLVVDI
jgi:pantoate--beta-alanine ligase